jgi:hypothetical protein
MEPNAEAFPALAVPPGKLMGTLHGEGGVDGVLSGHDDLPRRLECDTFVLLAIHNDNFLYRR